MATIQTKNRNFARLGWLRDNPVCHAWLLKHRNTPLQDLARAPEAEIMAASLREAGIYGKTTVKVDICAAMRRLACSAKDVPVTSDDEALEEIKTILARPGVDRNNVISKLLCP